MQGVTLDMLSDYDLFSSGELSFVKHAFLISDNEIKVYLKNECKQVQEIKLFDRNLEPIKISSSEITSDGLSVKLVGNFNLKENYIIKVKQDQVYVSLDPTVKGLLDTVFFDKETELGAVFENGGVTFRIWSPPAVRVQLVLFDKTEKVLNPSHELTRNESNPGIWEFKLDHEYINELKPNYYQYLITAYGKTLPALDPYAKSMAKFDRFSDDTTGKGAIINMRSSSALPVNFIRNYKNFEHIANENDLIIYEINVRDFTVQPGVTDSLIAGTFTGFTKKINYLKQLGITHVQFMPVHKAYTQNEIDRSYSGRYDEDSRYNWGYDPMNYFTLEGRYSTDPYDPYKRIFEFRQLIQALHDAGIGVIIDVVFNHTFNADVFERAAPGCYYRYTHEHRISGHTGAGPSIESRRLQVRKFIKDVLKFYVEEYHIDGFRFDLMSFTDKETMEQIRNEIGRIYNPENINELILHGEAWNFSDLDENAYVKTDFQSMNIGIFNDTFRDSLAGNGYFHGFIHGNTHLSGKLASGIVGGIKSYDQTSLPFYKNDFFDPYNLFAENPSDCLNFISIHDGLTLWDKINISVKDSSKKDRLKLMKFAAAILFTSQGKIILHGGDEILRTKPKAEYDKESDRTITSELTDIEEETVFFHENSYRSPDFTNKFRWSRLTDEYAEFAEDLLNYYKGLISMRRHIPSFRFLTAEHIRRGLQFLPAVDSSSFPKFISFRDPDIENLTLKFINGKPNSTLYLTGEIHTETDNPTRNPMKVEFNNKGIAELMFTKKQINSFNLNKWSSGRYLDVKLVNEPGKWEFPSEYYSQFGCNSLAPESINDKNEIVIDLSIKDYRSTFTETIKQPDFIAYTLKNDLESFTAPSLPNTDLKTLLVIHNPQNKNLKIYFNELLQFNFFVITDDKHAGHIKLEHSNVLIYDEFIYVPAQSTAVLASYQSMLQY